MIVRDALAYPFRGGNLGVMAMGAVLACVPPLVYAVLPNLPYVLTIGLIAEGFVLCYLALFFYSVMESGTKGEERFPGWPEVGTFHDIAGRVAHVLGPLVVSFLPMILYWAYVAISGAWRGVPGVTASQLWITAGLAVAGFAYLPIAFLLYSFHGELAVLNVVAAVRSVARMAGDYARVVALSLGLFGVWSAVGRVLVAAPAVVAVPFAALAGFCVLTVAMRAIGLLYHRNRARLGWERVPRELPDPSGAGGPRR
ncbi:MAG: hypothetical protein HYY17_03640 [Planctomycetes bacterium]|nr:hypothetical protein [Planctomycetota bacterium]